MSGKTCQFCGKPLNRIWVGAGDGFCSREHRNQYRLRRGMDRLQEANKVATLMRRRESPKPIAVSDLRIESDTARRGFLDLKRFPVREPLPLHTRLAPRSARPSIQNSEAQRRTRYRAVVQPVRAGARLRVSMSAGFRLPALRYPAARISPSAIFGQATPGPERTAYAINRGIPSPPPKALPLEYGPFSSRIEPVEWHKNYAAKPGHLPAPPRRAALALARPTAGARTAPMTATVPFSGPELALNLSEEERSIS